MKTLLCFATLSFAAHAADPVLLKSGREIFASYVAITGLDANDQTLRDIYRLNIDRLPKTGAPEELSNTVIMGTTELGGIFCKQTLDREKTLPRGQRQLFADVNFARGPRQFDDYSRGLIFNDLGMAFWQRNATDAEKKALSKAIDTAVTKNSDDTDETVKLLQVICTTYASSLAFLVK
jgi:hypothetical protein